MMELKKIDLESKNINKNEMKCRCDFNLDEISTNTYDKNPNSYSSFSK